MQLALTSRTVYNKKEAMAGHEPVLPLPALTPPTAALALTRVTRPPKRMASSTPQLLALGSPRRNGFLRSERLHDDFDARLSLRLGLDDPLDDDGVRILSSKLPVGLDALRPLRDEEIDRFGDRLGVVVVDVDQVDDLGLGLADVTALALLRPLLLGLLLLRFLLLLATLGFLLRLLDKESSFLGHSTEEVFALVIHLPRV